MAINLEILDASQSQLTQNEQVKNMIDKGCDVVWCVSIWSTVQSLQRSQIWLRINFSDPVFIVIL